MAHSQFVRNSYANGRVLSLDSFANFATRNCEELRQTIDWRIFGFIGIDATREKRLCGDRFFWNCTRGW